MKKNVYAWFTAFVILAIFICYVAAMAISVWTLNKVLVSENQREVFGYLMVRSILVMAAILVVLLAAVVLLLRIGNLKISIQARASGLSVLANVYSSMHLIDLEKDRIEEIKSNIYINSFIDKEKQTASEQLKSAMTGMCTEEYQNRVLAFTDLSTLAERMKEKRTISMEFVGKYSGWCRARFIAEDENLEKVTQVIFAIEIIEAEKRREKELLELSELDRMTGIRNRVSGEKKIEELLHKKQPGTLFIFDADKFKSINDTYGHGVGDKVIIAIANTLVSVYREEDIVMRLGGDEFTVFLLDVTEEKEAWEAAYRFFTELEKAEIPELKGKTFSVSVGAVIYDGTREVLFEELYQKADTMMYESKKTEGNKYSLYQDQKVV